MNNKKRTVQTLSFWERTLLWFVVKIIKLWQLTLRLEVNEKDLSQLQMPSTPSLVLFWHNRLFIVPQWRNKYDTTHIPYAGLVSGSKDGAWIAGVYRLYGVKAVRGSSSWRGDAALRDALRTIKNGSHLAMTPDGPRGPIYKFKPGAAAIAKMANCPIMLCSSYFENSWKLKSWDSFILPKPFSRVITQGIRYENIQAVPGETLEEKSLFLERKLLELNDLKK